MTDRLYVTSPLLPDLGRFKESLDEIWESRWLTNGGRFHREFEKRLAERLGVEYISVFTNGTLPLMAALELTKGDNPGLDEVITTPYSFVATSNVLHWLDLKPVFVDVDRFGNIDPDGIEEAMTERTLAVLAVHVYGNPCQVERIGEIAGRRGARVVYDAAHAFGVEKNGRSILLDGDFSTLSFHATKVFNTLEGGALVCHSEAMKRRIDNFKNFGIEDEVTVSEFGINCKMDEVRAAYGLLNLERVDGAVEWRRQATMAYRSGLAGIDGISFFDDIDGVKHNYSYFPVFVGEGYRLSRDGLYNHLKENGIFARRYFYPLISDFKIYDGCRKFDLANARRLADSVLCLPLYNDISLDDVERVIEVIR